MKPVDQTTFGCPGGNCFSACVASLFDLSIEEVPYFMGDAPAGQNDSAWWNRFLDWLNARGWTALNFELGPQDPYRPEGFYILSGPAERGFDHSVVARGTKIVHDPHPSRAGLLSHHDVLVLMPLDPAAPAFGRTVSKG